MNDFRKLANNEGYLVDLQGVKIYFPQESIDHVEKGGHMNPKDASGSVFKRGIQIENIFKEMIENSSKKEVKGNMIQFETNSHIGYDAYIDNMTKPDGFIIKTDRDKKVLALAEKNDRFAVEGSFQSNATNILSGIVIDSASVKLDNIPSDFETRELYNQGKLNYGISLFPGRAFKLNGDPIPRTTQMTTEGFLSQENQNYIPVKLNSVQDYISIRDKVNIASLSSDYSASDLKSAIIKEVASFKRNAEINELQNRNTVFNPKIHVKKINLDGEEVIGFKPSDSEFSRKLENALNKNNNNTLQKEAELIRQKTSQNKI